MMFLLNDCGPSGRARRDRLFPAKAASKEDGGIGFNLG